MSSSQSDRLRELLRRYLDAGASLSRFNRAELEELARDLLVFPSRERIEDALEELRDRSRQGVDIVFELLRGELRREVENFTNQRRDEYADVVERAFGFLSDLFGTPRSGSRSDPPPTAQPVVDTIAKKAAPKKTAPKKTAPKKTAPKKTAAKKSAAKKSTVKKAAVKKAGAKKQGAKKSLTKKITAKKAGAKKATRSTGER